MIQLNKKELWSSNEYINEVIFQTLLCLSLLFLSLRCRNFDSLSWISFKSNQVALLLLIQIFALYQLYEEVNNMAP